MDAFDGKELLYEKYRMIREAVSARDVGRVLGLDIDSKGRCSCPFHNGRDRNMMVFDNRDGHNGYNCYVCHANGDSISLAKQLLGNDCRYHDAAKWIDDTFQLGVFEKKRLTVRERIRRAQLNARCNGGAR